MKFETLRFGEITFEESGILVFPKGILGFPQSLKYTMVEEGDESPFFWLQSLDEPDIAFIIVDPETLLTKYKVEVDQAAMTDIQADDPEQIKIYVIVTIPESIERATMNLRGPILLNLEQRLGMQMVLQDDTYPLRYPLRLPTEPEEKPRVGVEEQ